MPKTVTVALRKESVDRNNSPGGDAYAGVASLSARRAWIEMPCLRSAGRTWRRSLSARRAWIEIFHLPLKHSKTKSLSARRAWIEMPSGVALVANLYRSLSARRAWIEIKRHTGRLLWQFVALRKESVDRNVEYPVRALLVRLSLSARRAWIEIVTAVFVA